VQLHTAMSVCLFNDNYTYFNRIEPFKISKICLFENRLLRLDGYNELIVSLCSVMIFIRDVRHEVEENEAVVHLNYKLRLML